jgi:hypothetical protein
MPGNSSWMPYAPQGVKGSDDDDDDEVCLLLQLINIKANQLRKLQNFTLNNPEFCAETIKLTFLYFPLKL